MSTIFINSPPLLSDPGRDQTGPLFEFRLNEPATMLTADELFCEGKLLPFPQSISSLTIPKPDKDPISELPFSDLSISSPKTPKCSTGWRHIFGFTKAKKIRNPTPIPPQSRSNRKVLQPPASILLPVRESDSDSSSRLSLSSTSSDSSDPSRFSEDSDRIRTRSVKRTIEDAGSPRMNASGKVVFGRSSSTPGSFSGGSRSRVRTREMMNRSYSASRVLNVPVCSGSGLGFFGSGKGSSYGKLKMTRR